MSCRHSLHEAFIRSRPITAIPLIAFLILTGFSLDNAVVPADEILSDGRKAPACATLDKNQLENLGKNPDLELGPVIIPTAVTSSGGIVTKSVKTASELVLNEEEMRLFQNPTTEPRYVYIATDLDYSPTVV